ncbi:MAG: energy-coupling factor transporter transmembrane component T family protein [Promethearchaeota archaeon]
MNLALPFRHIDEKTILSRIHPIVRLILPFFFVIPFLFVNNIYLIITFIMITLIIAFIARLRILRILTRIRTIIPFVILITIFIPFYVGDSVAYQLQFGCTITIYQEGLSRALLLFMRIIGATFIFMTFYSAFTYSEFVEAITTMRLPSFFVGSFIIMLHYIPIIAGSNRRIVEAQELRGKKVTTYWEKLKAHAFIMGKSLVMNLERSEKIYESLKMRGFSGAMNFATRKIRIWDLLIIVIFFGFMVFFVFIIDVNLLIQEVL